MRLKTTPIGLLAVAALAFALASCPMQNYSNVLSYNTVGYGIGQCWAYSNGTIMVIGPNVTVGATGTWTGGDGVAYQFSLNPASSDCSGDYSGIGSAPGTIKSVAGGIRLYTSSAFVTVPLASTVCISGTASLRVNGSSCILVAAITLADGKVLDVEYSGPFTFYQL